MDAPFLELTYYVGPEKVGEAQAALSALHKSAGRRLIGLGRRPEEVHVENGFVILRTEGEDFCSSMRDKVVRLNKYGAKVATTFVQLAEELDCHYGAILIEYTLETPGELREGLRSIGFRNFYISRVRLPETLVAKILGSIPSSAYVSEQKKGAYVSMTPEYNPSNSGVEYELSHEVSIRIGSLIGSAYASRVM